MVEIGNKSDPNVFSLNLIETFTNRTASKVIIRVGGTSGDSGRYVPSQAAAVAIPASQSGANVPSGLTIGPSYFESFQTFGNNSVQWVYMVPLAELDLANSVEETKVAVQSIGIDNIYAIEIGNEPDLYVSQMKRSVNYGCQQYVVDWFNYVSALTGNITAIPSSSRFFEALTLSKGYVGQSPWTM